MLILSKIDEILNRCEMAKIKIMLLKGVAMILLFKDYIMEREIEDVDILVEKEKYNEFTKILEQAGYRRVIFDPCAFISKDGFITFDVVNKIWYLSNLENKKLWYKATKLDGYNNIFIPHCEDLYTYTLFHSYLHPEINETKWEKDLALLTNKCGINVVKLKKIKLIRNSHIMKLLFLPFKYKITYLFELIFPSIKFIKNRYSVSGLWTLLYMFFRPFLILKNFLVFILNLCYITSFRKLTVKS